MKAEIIQAKLIKKTFERIRGMLGYLSGQHQYWAENQLHLFRQHPTEKLATVLQTISRISVNR